MPTRTQPELWTASILTAPAPGGIAVVQVVTRGGLAALAPLLHPRSRIDLATISNDQLLLCRVIDQGEVLDDAVVAARSAPDGAHVVDINLHGGPRIVQRVLLALKRMGAEVVEPFRHMDASFATFDALDREMLTRLPSVKTRGVAAWQIGRAHV